MHSYIAKELSLHTMFVYMELSTIFKHCQVMKSWVGLGTRLIYMYMQFSTTHAHVVIRERVKRIKICARLSYATSVDVLKGHY